jgi:tetratricopeptide (TPR) repeat protein
MERRVVKYFVLKTTLVIYLFVVLVSQGEPQTRDQVFIGARPLGLGETYVAIADDGNAAYWNPAGMPGMNRMEFNSMYANLYNINGLQNIYLSFIYPITPRYSVGASWFHFGFDDTELEFFRNKLNVSFGAKVYKNLSLGTSLKYLNTDARLDGFSEGKADGAGFDLGALYTIPLKNFGVLKHMNLGVAAYDVGGTDITYSDTDKSEEILSQNIRYGFSLHGAEEVSLKWFSVQDPLLSFDFDDRFHVGGETWLFDLLAIRTGIQKDFHTDEGITYSFGGSLRFPYLSMQLDYAYVNPPTLSSTHVVSFTFIPSVSPVKITDVSMDDIYASLYKTYATGRIGYVTVRNDYDKELDITLRVDVPGLMKVPTSERFVLGPDEKETIRVPAVFSEDIMDVRGSGYQQANISVEYEIKNERKQAEISKKFTLYGRGATTWDNPGKAAAFVTKMDRMVDLFAREATGDLPYRSEVELGNIYTAAALFDALGVIGIKYRTDPERPFPEISKSQHSVDYIQYPAELLLSKQGDCDDLTVLYASLLENSGVRTAFTSTDNHIFLMFDTGIHEQNWGILPVGDSLVVVRDKSLWIPVEVTEVGNSFARAWEVGGRKYRESEHNQSFEIVAIQDVEGLYLSALPADLQNRLPASPSKGEMDELLESDFSWIEQRRSSRAIENYLAELSRDQMNTGLRNRLGIIYAQQDSIEQAERQFQMILQRDPNHPQGLINTANVHFISGRFPEAEETYLKGASMRKDEAGVHLNLAILYQLWKDVNPADSVHYQTESERHLHRAFELLDGDELLALDMLGIAAEEIDLGQKADFRSWVKQKAEAVKIFIKKNSKKYLFNKSVTGAQLVRKGVKREAVDKDRRYIVWWAYK